jgi:hypothetical protein
MEQTKPFPNLKTIKNTGNSSFNKLYRKFTNTVNNNFKKRFKRRFNCFLFYFSQDTHFKTSSNITKNIAQSF